MKYYLWQSSFALSVVILSLIFATIVIVYLTRRGNIIISKPSANWLLAGLLIWICLEHCLGRYSTLFGGDEGNVVPPFLNYIANFISDDQLFAHEFLGGIDRFAMVLIGSQYFSPELLLSKYFPMWAVVMVHKLASVGFGLTGIYLLCRKVASLPRYISLIAASVYFAIDPEHIDNTLIFGPSWGSLPLIAYLAAYPLSRSRYSFFLSVAGLAILFSLLPPTHIGTAAGATLTIAIICFYRGPTWRPILAIVSVLVAVIANWHEVLWSFWQISSETSKGVPTPPPSSAEIFLSLSDNKMLIASIGAILVLFTLNDRLRIPGLISVLATILFLPILKFTINLAPSLHFLLAIKWEYSLEAIDVFGLLVIIRAAHSLQIQLQHSPRLRRYLNLNAALFGLFVFMSLFYKGGHFYDLIHQGAYSQFTSIENLRTRPWQIPGLYRVVTLRAGPPEPNIAPGFYGLDALDGQANLAPTLVYQYWNLGILKKSVGGTAINIDTEAWSRKDLEIDLNSLARTELLRAANVQYVFSAIPIKEEGFHLVSSPSYPKKIHDMHRGWEDKLRYYKRQFKKIDKFGKIYIYRLQDAVPRAFGAVAIAKGSDQEEIRDSIFRGAAAALSRRARIAETDALSLGDISGQVTVKNVKKTKNGYALKIHAPSKGAVVLNVPFTSYWRASVDRVEARITRANFIQMMVKIPKGAEKVEFSYDRQMLRDFLIRKLYDSGKFY